jgi:hypothetical protein
VATFSVTLPVVAVLLNVMVLFEELKFEDPFVKVRTGKLMAPDGLPVMLADNMAVPLNPLATFSVSRPVPDKPWVLMVIGDKDPGVKLNPLTAMVRFPETAVFPPESVTFTVNGDGEATAEATGVPEITPAVDKDRPSGRAPEFRVQFVYGVTPPVAAKVVAM